MPENETGYPEFSMFGELPSWAFYLRHVKGITMRNINVRLADKDFRPTIVMEDVKNENLENTNIPENMVYVIE